MSGPLIGLDAIFGDGEEQDRPDLARLMELRRHGVCSAMSPALFYPVRGQSAVPAKAACRRCPVRGDCLAYAVEHREWHGVWGGTTEKERRALNLLHGQGQPIDEVVAKALAGDLEEEMAARRSVARRRGGRTITKTAPYGWRFDAAGVVADEGEQAVMAALRRWAGEGVTPAEASRRLNEARIQARGGRRWRPSTVVSVLGRRSLDHLHDREQAS